MIQFTWCTGAWTMVTFLLVMGLKKYRNMIFFEIPLVRQSKSPAWQIVQKTFQALERSLHNSLTPVPVWFSQFCLCWRQSPTRRPGVSVAFSSCPVGQTSPWNCPHSPPLTCRLSILQPARMNEHKCQSYQVVDKSVMMMWTKLSRVKFTKFQTHLIFIKRCPHYLAQRIEFICYNFSCSDLSHLYYSTTRLWKVDCKIQTV